MEPGGGARVRGVGVQQGSVGQVLLRGSVAAGLPSVLERARHRTYAAHSGARPSPWGPCPAAPTAYRDHGRPGLGGFVLRVGPGHRWRQHAARPVATPRRPTKPAGEHYRAHTAAGHHTDFQPPVTPAQAGCRDLDPPRRLIVEDAPARARGGGRQVGAANLAAQYSAAATARGIRAVIDAIRKAAPRAPPPDSSLPPCLACSLRPSCVCACAPVSRHPLLCALSAVCASAPTHRADSSGMVHGRQPRRRLSSARRADPR